MTEKRLPVFYCSVLFALFLPLSLKSQIYPAEGSKLHFRLIGFCFSDSVKAAGYRLEIAEGDITSGDSFKTKIIKSIESYHDSIIAEVPSFGRQYTWRFVSTRVNGLVTRSALHHFSTLTSPKLDTSQFHFIVMDTAAKYSDNYLFLDDNQAMYDMKGNPVWFMPDIDGKKVTPRDLKTSPAGTITFLFDPPYEISYYGEVLWIAPGNAKVSGGYSENFNHEFTRLGNGHYMVLGEDSGLVSITNQLAEGKITSSSFLK